jgi:hypothetical protein
MITESSNSALAADMLERALAGNAGRREWREFKAEQARELFDLFAQSPRVTPLGLDLSIDFGALYSIAMPVPCRPQGDQLRIANRAVFHLRYAEEWRWQPPAGFEPLGVLDPIDLFGPNMIAAPQGGVCLGRIPPGITVRELALLGYFAVTLQTYQLNEIDPQGILNPAACEYFRLHQEWLPLTRAGLFDEWTPSDSPAF